MRKALGLALVLLTVWVVQGGGQERIPLGQGAVVGPEIPRVSAYEAYVKFKSGKAIILHAGGDFYRNHHIMMAFNLENRSETLDVENSAKGRTFRKLPKEGIEIFIYCY